MDDKEQLAVAKQRLANFRFRQAPSSSTSTTVTMSNAPSANSLTHSHSRNGSATDSLLSTTSLSKIFSADESQAHSVPSSPSPRSRPNSHHRRRSSVSTRRESAEMMGVAAPLEAGSDAVGDQAELRRLALWKLEGKTRPDNPFIGSFTKVEIPEFDTLDLEVTSNDIQVPKPMSPLSPFGVGSTLAGKRDSFGKLLISASNSLKDQLHTLMEEEEEEDADETKGGQAPVKLTQEVNAADDSSEELSQFQPVVPSLNRSRPTNLILRPLSLTPESLPSNRTEALHTPRSLTPSPRVVGLKALTLFPSPSVSPAPSDSSISPAPSRRQSLTMNSPSIPADYIQRRQSISTISSTAASAPRRKSSISYIRAASNDFACGYLPTPEQTPTSPLPPLHVALPSRSSSSSGLVPDLTRPLSPSEQAFLFRSHTSLLSRISDLEQAIAGVQGKLPPGAGVKPTSAGSALDELCDRPKSLEASTAGTTKSITFEVEAIPSQPSNEMLQLVSDLKSERDELMRDAEGWRTRVTDLEKQIGTLTRRVEAERREGWVVRERLGFVELEKKRIKEEMERERLDHRRVEKALQTEELARRKAEEDRTALSELLKQEQTKREENEREIRGLRFELGQLRARAEQADADLQALLITPKVPMTMQIPVSRRISSVDSQTSTSSATDVEEYLPVGLTTLKLNAVEEEDENRDLPRDVTSENGSEVDNDELAHYEDDEDLDDMIFDDDTSSSCGSIAHSNSHLLRLDLAVVTPGPLSGSAPNSSSSHTKTGSMEKGWSFPQGSGPSPSSKAPLQVDHFFECLDALDQCDNDEAGGLPTYDSSTAKQQWRCAVKDSGDDEMPPFVLPVQPNAPRKEKEWKEIEGAKLEVVTEEDEEAISFEHPSSPAAPEQQHAVGAAYDPVTPRAVPVKMTIPPGTSTVHVNMSKGHADITLPGFKPCGASVPILKAPPPSKKVGSSMPPKTPEITDITEVAPKPPSPTLTSQFSHSSTVSTNLTSPSKPRASIPGPTLIPRLSLSPKTSPVKTTSTTARAPTKSPTLPVFATKLMSPSKLRATSMPPVFIPHSKTTNKSVTRSSLLPPKPPVLTRLSIPQQTATSASPSGATPSLKQGLTATFSQQMQNLSILWSPWSPSPGNVVRQLQSNVVPEQRRVKLYVNKEQQLRKLQLRLQVEDVLTESCEECASCRGSVISI